MLAVSDLEVRVADRLLIQPTSFRINPGQCIGLVGRNGAGKTTMMRILAGEGLPASGRVNVTGSIGYLPQDPRESDLQITARTRILQARGIDQIREKMKRYEALMAEPGSDQEDAMARYAKAEAQFIAADGYAAESEAARIAHNVGIEQRVLNQPLHELSGGQRRRIELARILFSDAQTLLLDEPTNHLDHDSIVWLRDFLKTYHGGVMMISHDTALLEACVSRVFHLDANRQVIDQYTMGWKAYLEKRESDEKARRRERANAERKAAQLLAQAAKLGAKATKAAAAHQMTRRAEALLANTAGLRVDDKVAKIEFPDPAPCGKVPLRAEEICKWYGSLEVFTGVDLAIDRGSRVVILGLNGAGKTTLLRLLMKLEDPDIGDVIYGHGLKIGYFAQEHDMLDPHQTVLENMMSAAPQLNETSARNVLGSFLFSGDDSYKLAAVLSGGEKTRLALATLVVSAANVLLLDEPTNNLDPASREQVLNAIRNYAGAIVLVTHDEGAVEALEPDRVIILPEGTEDLWSSDYNELVSLA